MIKYLVMDVDGTLTDGKIYMGNNGEAMKAFNIKDGYGIHDILPQNHILPIIITGRNSDILLNRCRELGIENVVQNVEDKAQVLNKLTDGKLNYVAYIGDDLNDMPAMQAVKNAGGIVGCPSDAICEIQEMADFISQFKGGDGAVREFIDRIVRLQNNRVGNGFIEWDRVD